jgi:uncharacterized membrane protein
MNKERFWEIDAIRGLAIIRMVSYNWSFALYFLGIYTFALGLVLPGLSACVFIFLSGISLTISYHRIRNSERYKIFKKYSLRGLKVLGMGMIITAVTFLAFRSEFIIFGILHFVGVSIFLGQFFIKYRRLNLVLGILIIIFGLYIQGLRFDFPWLLWLGLTPSSFSTFDYFPLLPWFGITLLGIAAGNTLYRNGNRIFRLKDMSSNLLVRFLSFLGRNSLKIYLLHQPLLILMLMILGFRIF